MSDFRKSKAWSALAAHAKKLAPQHIKDLFKEDPDRSDWGTITAAGLTLDISKNRVTRQTIDLLSALATEKELAAERERMSAGDQVNGTEARAALHMALRGEGAASAAITQSGEVKARFLDYARSINSDNSSQTHKHIDRIIHIGIGGSDLGPRLVQAALGTADQIQVHFVANIDPHELNEALDGADPAATIFIVVSKSFTTQETIENAKSAKAWLEANLPAARNANKQFVAVTENTKAAASFGIIPDRIFPFGGGVGGRFSVWSSVGLTLAITLGEDAFNHFLSGAAEMDRHFLDAPLERNLPVLLALVGVWNRNFLGIGSHAVLPYSQRLALLPSYLQQLEMESNGKSVRRNGHLADVETAPTIWGAAGTTGQHAFYQWLHQGADLASCDVILPLGGPDQYQHHQDILLANGIAQAEALAFGRNRQATEAALAEEGLSEAKIARLAPHRTFQGNRPVTVISMDRLEPKTLGALIALYEHKVFTQGILWDINSFDQWGVELGKNLAGGVLKAITGDGPVEGFDPSTRRLINAARQTRTKTTRED